MPHLEEDVRKNKKPSNRGASTLAQERQWCRFNPANPPQKPIPLLLFQGQVICTAGNISNIQGPAKSAKSAVLGGMLAAVLKALLADKSASQGEVDTRSTLGFSSRIERNTRDRKESVILHFDTEQSPYDHHTHVMRMLARAGIENTGNLPLYSYSLVEFDIAQRRDAIEAAIKTLNSETQQVVCIFLDGVADVLRDPNNAEEAFELVSRLHQLAVEGDLAIVTVLHENPGAVTGKTRGHLGSQTERKSETNLRVVKDEKDGTSTIWVERARHCHIPKDRGVKIRWDSEAKHHVLQPQSAKPGPTAKASKQSSAVEEAADDGIPAAVEGFLVKNLSAPLNSTELAKRIEKQFKVGKRTAKDRIKTWETAGWIRKASLRAPWEFGVAPSEFPAEETVTTTPVVEAVGSEPVAIITRHLK